MFNSARTKHIAPAVRGWELPSDRRRKFEIFYRAWWSQAGESLTFFAANKNIRMPAWWPQTGESLTFNSARTKHIAPAVRGWELPSDRQRKFEIFYRTWWSQAGESLTFNSARTKHIALAVRGWELPSDRQRKFRIF